MKTLLLFGEKTKKEAISFLEEIEKEFKINVHHYKEKINKYDDGDLLELAHYGDDKERWVLENASENELIFDHHILGAYLEEKKYDNLDISRIVEIGIILKYKHEYFKLLNKQESDDLEGFGDLCISIYNAWNNIKPEELKCKDNYGYITDFMNNEIEIVSAIINKKLS